MPVTNGRREVVAALGGAAARPLAARAQQAGSRSWGSSASCASVAHLAAVSHAAWLLVRMWCFPFSSISSAMVAPWIALRSTFSPRRGRSGDGGELLAASITEQPP
jgi:hypothetical protein